MSSRTLLLGAGFSRNFGLPLAKEVLTEMFNIVESLQLKVEILNIIESGDNDFEAYYAKKTNRSITSESQEITEALLSVYNAMDAKILRTIEVPGREEFSSIKVISFINKFSAHQGGCGYVFTLNQDLLLERLFVDYLKLKKFSMPGGWNGEHLGGLLPLYGPVDSPFYKYNKDDPRDKKTTHFPFVRQRLSY